MRIIAIAGLFAAGTSFTIAQSSPTSGASTPARPTDNSKAPVVVTSGTTTITTTAGNATTTAAGNTTTTPPSGTRTDETKRTATTGTTTDDRGGPAKGPPAGVGAGPINSGRRPDDNASETAKAVTAVVQQFEAARAKAIDDRKALITQLEAAKTETDREAILAKLKAETQAERDQQAMLGKQVRDELKKVRDTRAKPGS